MKVTSCFLVFSILVLAPKLYSQESSINTIAHPFRTNVFIKNHGQYDTWVSNNNSKIDYFIRNGGMFFLQENGLIIKTRKKIEAVELDHEHQSERIEEKRIYKNYTVRLNWLGTNSNKVVENTGMANGYYTYGQPGYESLKARGFQQVTYKNIYPNIDLIYEVPKGDSAGLKYNIVIHPNGTYKDIRFRWTGDIQSTYVDKDGSLIIETKAGMFKDYAPVAYYKDSKEKINVEYIKEESGIVSFKFPDGVNSNQELVIDPWVITPTSLDTDNKAYDVDFDSQGNTFAAGGTYPYNLSKYDVNGSLLWTYTWPASFGATANYSYYGEFGLIRNTGTVMLGEPLGSQLNLIKLNGAGTVTYHDSISGPNNEIWTLFHNSCTGEMLGFGGGTSSLENLLLFSDTSFSSVQFINSNGATGICCNDIADAIIDDDGDIYQYGVSLSGTTPSIANTIFKNLQSNSYAAPSAFTTYTGYSFDECGCSSPTFSDIGAANIMALDKAFLYSYDGKMLHAWNKNNGSVLDSLEIKSSYARGSLRNHQGIAVNPCSNIIYVAGELKIHKVLFDGSTLTYEGDVNVSLPGSVYDLVVDGSTNTLHASGENFVATIKIPGCDPLDLTYNQEKISCTETKISLQASGGTSPYRFKWSTGDTSSTALLPGGTYTIRVEDASCIRKSVIDTFVVEGEPPYDSVLFVPNVFTPNEDGSNERFKVATTGYTTFNISIFNRWGQLMYKSSNNDGWDGKTPGGKNAPAGTYYYIIELSSERCNEIKTKLYKGDLTLLR